MVINKGIRKNSNLQAPTPSICSKTEQGIKLRALKNRFWPKVNKTDKCWEWTGGLNCHGYGWIRYDGRPHLAHRISLYLVNGEHPKLLVCHKCDNRKCVRPSHLFLGTHKDNMQDAVKKGRMAKGLFNGRKTHPELTARGETNGKSIVNDNIVRRVRGIFTGTKGEIAYLARLFGTSHTAMWNIIKENTWKHVK